MGKTMAAAVPGRAMTARDLALAFDSAAEERATRWWARCPLCAHATKRVALWDTAPDGICIVAVCGCPTRKPRAHVEAAP
jgi:hypothetical protein